MTDQVVTVTQQTVGDTTTDGGHFSLKAQVEATLSLATLVIALLVVFGSPPMRAALDFYHGHLSRRSGWRLSQPPRAPMLMLWSFVCALLLYLASVYYLYNDVNNIPAFDWVANYYVAYLALLVADIGLIFMWKSLVWNLYDRTWAMWIAMIFSVLIVFIEFVMFVLMAVRYYIFPAVMLFLSFVIHLPLPFWTWVLYSYFKKPKKSRRHSRG